MSNPKNLIFSKCRLRFTKTRWCIARWNFLFGRLWLQFDGDEHSFNSALFAIDDTSEIINEFRQKIQSSTWSLIKHETYNLLDNNISDDKHHAYQLVAIEMIHQIYNCYYSFCNGELIKC